MKIKIAVASFLLSVSTLAQASDAVPYCAAVRGNGESMPAHWGALANMMETYGAPSGMAGGSSASVTAFLWESATMNPLISHQSQFRTGRELALSFKSLEGVTEYLYSQPRWKALAAWISAVRGAGFSQSSLNGISTALNSSADSLSALNELKRTELFNGPAVKAILAAGLDASVVADPLKMASLRRQLNEVRESIEVFGKFDAKSDQQLFVRQGIVDFAALARQFSVLGDFMSLRNASAEAISAYGKFLKTCAVSSPGRSWSELIALKPQCKTLFAAALDSYFTNYVQGANTRVNDVVGANRRILVSTSIVRGESAKRFRDIRSKYLDTAESDQDLSFQVQDEDLRFGYWGSPQVLQKIEAQFKSAASVSALIDKSKRFLSLGSATWLQALTLSPAEPGLSSAQDLSSVGLKSDLISFGGWSDLHPVPVLKAAGCERVVYVQRRGGDALFSMGVAKRLLGFDRPSWSELDSNETGTHRSEILNNNGLATDLTSQWSMLYNLRNPNSSYAISLAEADAVICTNWNLFDIKSQFSALIDDSYRAPIFAARGVMQVAPRAKAKFITAAENQVDSSKGFAPYAGCIPLE